MCYTHTFVFQEKVALTACGGGAWLVWVLPVLGFVHPCFKAMGGFRGQGVSSVEMDLVLRAEELQVGHIYTTICRVDSYGKLLYSKGSSVSCLL